MHRMTSRMEGIDGQKLSHYTKKMGRRRIHNKNYPRHLQVKDGCFYFVIHIAGKDKWIPLKTRDLGTALKRWAEVEVYYKEQNEGFDTQKAFTDRKNITFKALKERFMSEVVVHLSDATERNYSRMTDELVKVFGKRSIQGITRQEIIRYHDGLRATPFEANRRVGLIRLLFQKALDWGYLSVNQADGIKKFKEKKHKLRLTAPILFGKIYPNASTMLKRAIMLAFHLVQHENEIKRLQWKHFDLEQHIVSFTRRKTDEDIVINYSANSALMTFLKKLKTSRKDLSPYLISQQSKKGWMPYNHFRSMWLKALEEAGYEIGTYKFKEIRHLANTLMKDANISVDKRRAMTGHKTIQANEVYTHVSGTDTIEAGQALSNYKPDSF